MKEAFGHCRSQFGISTLTQFSHMLNEDIKSDQHSPISVA